MPRVPHPAPVRIGAVRRSGARGCHRRSRRDRRGRRHARDPDRRRPELEPRNRPDDARRTRGATLVTARRRGRIDIPFFGWFFRPLVGIAGNRAAAYAIAMLQHAFGEAPAPEPPRGVVGLPNVAFTLGTSDPARRRVGRGGGHVVRQRDLRSARRSDRRFVPRVRCDALERARDHSPRRDPRALRDRARRPPGSTPRHPHRCRRHRVRVRVVGRGPDARHLHRRAGAAARLREHHPDRRRHRGDRGGSGRSAGVLRLDARARGRIRLLVRGRRAPHRHRRQRLAPRVRRRHADAPPRTSHRARAHRDARGTKPSRHAPRSAAASCAS